MIVFSGYHWIQIWGRCMCTNPSPHSCHLCTAQWSSHNRTAEERNYGEGDQSCHPKEILGW